MRKTIENQIAYLKNTLAQIEYRLKNVPKGYLKIQARKGKVYYYHHYKAKDTKLVQRKYITRKDAQLAQVLAQKGYDERVKPLLQKELKELESFLKKYDENRVDTIYDTMSAERKKLVHPVRESIQEQMNRWQDEKYEVNTKYKENLIYETENGEMVRSKSEVIIANMLRHHKKYLLYKYERPLEVVIDGKVTIIYPDFTILNCITGKIVYWEHAGRMDDVRYTAGFVQKMNIYAKNNIVTGHNLIVTYETMNYPLDIKVVKNLIEMLINDIEI